MSKIYTACDSRIIHCPDVIYKDKFVYIIDDYGNIVRFYDIIFNDLVKSISTENNKNYITIKDDNENEVCMLKIHWAKIVENHNSKE